VGLRLWKLCGFHAPLPTKTSVVNPIVWKVSLFVEKGFPCVFNQVRVLFVSYNLSHDESVTRRFMTWCLVDIMPNGGFKLHQSEFEQLGSGVATCHESAPFFLFLAISSSFWGEPWQHSLVGGY
jgi:hypothetical protein